MVNDWLNSLDDERTGPPQRTDSRSDPRLDRRSEPTALGALMHYRLLTTSLVLLGLLGGAVAGFLLMGSPSAQARIAVTNLQANKLLKQSVASEAGFQTYVAQRASFVTTPAVLDAASSATGVPAETLRSSVTATVADGGVILVTATADTGATASAIADAVVKAYVDQSTAAYQAEGKARLDVFTKRRDDINNATKVSSVQQVANAASLKEADATIGDLQSDLTLSVVKFTTPAEVAPYSLVSTVGRYAGMGAAVGLLVASIFAFALADRLASAASYRRHNRTLAPQPTSQRR